MRIPLPTSLIIVLHLLACSHAFAVDAQLPTVNDPRLQLKLFAEAPQIVTPTGIEVDAQGRVYVIENLTHFRPPEYQGPKKDRIRLFEDTNNDGAADKISTFYQGLTFTTDLAFGADNWLYVATRASIIRIRDDNKDGVADTVESIIRLDTTGDYPHNGISGLAFDQSGTLYFGFGENLGHAYKMIGTDGVTLAGEAEGGTIYHVQPDGSKLTRVATGFWNPFGLCFTQDNTLFAVDNDPGGSPPCRLLHIVPGGNYGFEFRYGRSGQHQFVTWNAELPGTLPRVAGTGEAPCGVIAYRGNNLPAQYRNQLFVASWGDNRLEHYSLQPQGASFTSKTQVIIQGDENFRPVGIATGPDGAIYFTDWVDRDYAIHGKGRIWKLSTNHRVKSDNQKQTLDQTESQPRQLAKQLRDAKSQADITRNINHLTHNDLFIRNAAITGLTLIANQLSLQTFNNETDPVKRIGLLIAFKRSKQLRFSEKMPTFLADPDEDIRFSAIKWISDNKLIKFKSRLTQIFNAPNLTPRILGAALAAIDRLDGKKPHDFVNEIILFAKIQDDNASPAIRAMCLQLVRADHPNLTVDLLQRLIDVNNAALTLEVLRTASGHARPDRGRLLAKFASDTNQSAKLRATAITGLSWFAADHKTLLIDLATQSNSTLRDDALAALVGATLTDSDRSRINAIPTNNSNTTEAIARLLGTPRPSRPVKTDTAAWLQLIDQATDQPADPTAGRRVFASATIGMCSRCHVAENRGLRVGPNLTSLAGMDRTRLLQSILEPNREIAPEYVPHALTTKDGQTRLGLFLTAGGGSGREGYLGLDGLPFSVFADQLIDHQTLSISLMPQGLAQNMTTQELRDLIAYLQQLK